MEKIPKDELTIICVTVYANSLSMHINEMSYFFKDYMSNHQPPTLPSDTPMHRRIIWNSSHVDFCLWELCQYYYFVCNEYIFSELNNKDIDFDYFADLFYHGMGEDNEIRKHIDSKKINVEFYKNIEHYYDLEKRPLMKPVYEIMSPYIYNSELINIKDLKPTVKDGMVCLFSRVFYLLNSLPEKPEGLMLDGGTSYGQFNQLFTLMMNNTIEQTNEIIINAKILPK